MQGFVGVFFLLIHYHRFIFLGFVFQLALCNIAVVSFFKLLKLGGHIFYLIF